jgi:ATP-binding cassette subfamily F protein 3
LLAGKIQPQSGACKRHHKLDIAYFAQHQLDELNPKASAYDHVRDRLPEATEAQVRARAARFGLGTEKMDTPAADLSGGEKARLLLGLTTFAGPHLLILDEPTNHLDVEARQALAQSLLAYEGAVILISHDRHLVETCADRLWLVADGTVKVFDGDMETYRALVLDETSRGGDNNGGGKTGGDARMSQAERRKAAADERAAQAPLRKEIKTLEAQIAKLEDRVQDLDRQLSDGGIYQEDPKRAADLAKDKADALRDMVAAEEKWLDLSHQLEEAQARADSR